MLAAERGGEKKKKKKALWAKRKGRALIDEPCKLTVVPSRSCQCVSAKKHSNSQQEEAQTRRKELQLCKTKKKNKTKKCKKCSVHGSPPLDKKHSGNVMTTR